MADGNPRLVLASGSRFRRQLLEAAGLVFDVDPADIDEAALRAELGRKNPRLDPAEVALRLAEAKALAVSRRHAGAWVIGADQILACEGEIFAKPGSMAVAREHVARLSGQTHRLHSAIALVRNGDVHWSTVETALMTMRALSQSEIERYLAAAGPGICDTVGAYEFERLGAQLFEKVDGDQATIIGVPVLALLRALRDRRFQLP